MRTVQQGGTLSDCLAATGGRTPDSIPGRGNGIGKCRGSGGAGLAESGQEWTEASWALRALVGGCVLLWEPWWVLEKGQIWSMWGVIDGPVIKRNNIYWRNIY